MQVNDPQDGVESGKSQEAHPKTVDPHRVGTRRRADARGAKPAQRTLPDSPGKVKNQFKTKSQSQRSKSKPFRGTGVAGRAG